MSGRFYPSHARWLNVRKILSFTYKVTQCQDDFILLIQGDSMSGRFILHIQCDSISGRFILHIQDDSMSGRFILHIQDDSMSGRFYPSHTRWLILGYDATFPVIQDESRWAQCILFRHTLWFKVRKMHPFLIYNITQVLGNVPFHVIQDESRY